MQLLIQIICTVFFMACNVGGNHFLWKAIQEGEMFDKWRVVIDWADSKGRYNLKDFLGFCRVCFAHFTTILGFVAYVLFMREMDLYVIKGWVNIIWYLFYVAGTWWATMMSINETKQGTD